MVGASGDIVNVPNVEELPTYPDSGEYVPVRATGINYATAAKQWIRLPPLFVSAYNRRSSTLIDRRCPGGNLYPYATELKRHASMHFRSTPGAPASYGYVGPFTVRTVAFGSIPVEARVQLRQRRDTENKTVSLEIKAEEREFCPGQGPLPANKTFHNSGAEAYGDLELAVTQLKVDGVDLNMRSTCKTRGPAAIKLSSPEYFNTGGAVIGDPVRVYVRSGSGLRQLPADEMPDRENVLTSTAFNFSGGGLLTGNVDIPAFASCLTQDGQDISPLLTKTIAGSENPVVVRAEGLDSEPSEDPLPGLPFPTATP